VCKVGLEGVVSKRVDSAYVGKRSLAWLKIKCKRRQEFVIGGFTDPQRGRSGFGALLVGLYDSEGKFIYAGKVGTGFDEATLRELRGRLDSIKRGRSAFDTPIGRSESRGAHWVEPKLVAEVEFAEWTGDGRLRHPSFLGIRENKDPEAATPESPNLSGTANRSHVVAGADSGVEIAGVRITHPERVMYPEVGITKADLAAFYERIAPNILPHISNRPLTIVRCPKGQAEKCFSQRHLNESLPAAVRSVGSREKDKVEQYIVVDAVAGLLSLVQHSTLVSCS
jgi:bifunctional non-homologous end joining protein LigD